MPVTKRTTPSSRPVDFPGQSYENSPWIGTVNGEWRTRTKLTIQRIQPFRHPALHCKDLVAVADGAGRNAEGLVWPGTAPGTML